ncbi:flagellar filament capping protein FliD [Nocardioides caldifontis]|uniref:flagellar filament capping protein FliD n=1 Tax=Nocardioides caldifontis TaxID=2588938 RepID=UPI0011DFC2A6|nr:flagellar filament capping protein FliD [Nocardioides caldifontis]
MAFVSGLASGLDTSTIVSQLMAIERNSQTLLKTKLSTEQSNVKTLQELNTKTSSLATLAEKLSKRDAWNPVTITSSSEKVTATGTASATTGPISFTVDRLAAAHSVSFATTAAMTDVVVGGDPTKVQLTLVDGTVKEINAGDGSLGQLVGGLNAAGTGVKAGLVKLDDGTYRLRVTSTSTGQESAFTLAASDGSTILGGSTVLAQGQDAQITVGGDVLTSKSNTFAGVVTGLDITLQQGVEVGSTVDLSVAQDTDGIVTAVKELVDAVNALIGDMDKATAYGAAGTTTKSGTLAGDSQVRSVRNALLNAIYPQDGTSMAALGIETDRYGKLVLKEDKLRTALADDPAAVSAAFTAGASATSHGFAERVRSVAKTASDPVDGTFTSAIKGRTSTIDRLQDNIDAWDLRLELRENTLIRQFTAMETALSRLNSQSTWLAGQISSLPSYSDS